MQRHRLWRGIGTAVMIAVFVHARATAETAPPKKIATVEGISEYQLDNGVRVLLFPDASRPTVTVDLTVFVGSRHEGYGETGMAHLLEHMLFKGTPTHPNIPKLLQERGARFNGTTSDDRTNYYETMPASKENLEFGVHLEADRLVNSYIKREDLLTEMTVVRNEFEMGENSPQAILRQRMMAAAFEWHNYGKATIGNRSDIERVPIENLQAFYRLYYQPDNAMVIVAGQFDPAEALAKVQQYFGVIPRPRRQLQSTYTEEPPQDGERSVTLRRVGEVGIVGVLYHIPAAAHPDFPALQILSNILDSAPTGRLYKALVETKKASSVAASALGLHDPGVFGVQAEVAKGISLDEVSNRQLAIVEEIGVKGVTEEEVRRSKQQILRQRELAGTDTSILAVALSNWAAQGDWRLYFLSRDRVEKVTPEDVSAVATKYLRRSNRTVGQFIPTEKPERVAIPGMADVKTLVANYTGRGAGAEGEAIDLSPAGLEERIQRLTMSQGLKVALLPRKSRGEAVNVSLTLRYGNEENLKDFVSAASFLPQLMARGTRKLSYQQIQDELARLKARLNAGGISAGLEGIAGAGSSPGTATFTIEAKRETLSAVLALFRQVLREPALSAAEFEILRSNRLALLRQQKSDPISLAARELQRQLSPYDRSDIRYVPTVEEEIQRIEAVKVEQIRQLSQEFLGAQHGELVIWGDFDRIENMKLISEALADWKSAKPYARIERLVTAKRTGGKQVILMPDKANAAYIAGLSLPIRNDDPDYPALLMAGHVFGGGSLSSRLADRVRQKEGLSYAVGSGFAAASLDKNATLTVVAICNPQNMANLEKAILEELEKLIRDGVSAAELAGAKKSYLEQQKVILSYDARLGAIVSESLFEGRTLAFRADLEKKIEALTPTQIGEAVRKHFDPKKLAIVTVGDFERKTDGDRK